jgi:uncharacterized membrane protein YfcA
VIATLLIVAMVGGVAGTLLGERVLRRVPEAVFKPDERVKHHPTP